MINSFIKPLAPDKRLDFLLLASLLFMYSYIYSKYYSTISWGDDYGGYISFAQYLANGDLQKYINSRVELSNLYNTVQPVYTPIGLPLLLLLSKFLHNWNLLVIKLMIPISLIITYWVVNMMFKEKLSKFLLFATFINPWLIDQFRDIMSEIPALLFLLLGISQKRFKNLYFIISILIRPSYIVLVVVYMIFAYKKSKSIKSIFTLILNLLLIQIFSNYFFGINFYGNYATSSIENSSNFKLLFQNLKTFHFQDSEFILYEVGRLFTAVGNPLNLYIGILTVLILLWIRNPYGYMSIAFIFFHLSYPNYYYVRFFLPLVILASIGIVLKLETLNLNSLRKKYLMLLIAVLMTGYIYKIDYQINRLEIQRGPYQIESQEMLSYVKNEFNNKIFIFHAPRTFTLLTGFDSYRLNEELIDGTIIICEYNIEECSVPNEYWLKYKNKEYTIYEPKLDY
jgi:hypothetical protein